MPQMTYLSRRYGGVYYVQIRVTRFSKKSALLRFSLRTTDHHDARSRLLRYLHWLLPMQSPAEVDKKIANVIDQVRELMLDGPACNSQEAHFRHHFLSTGVALLEDWRTARPCPIEYRNFYRHQRELDESLGALGQLVARDFERFELPAADQNFLTSCRINPIAYVINEVTGAVRSVVPYADEPHWPEGSVVDYLAAVEEDQRIQPGERYLGEHREPRVWQSHSLVRGAGPIEATAAVKHPATPANEEATLSIPAQPLPPEVMSSSTSALGVVAEKSVLAAGAAAAPAAPGDALRATSSADTSETADATPAGSTPPEAGADQILTIPAPALRAESTPSQTAVPDGPAQGAPVQALASSGAPLMSALLAQCLEELLADNATNHAHRDLRPYVEFMIFILGDRPIAAYVRDDIRRLCLALTEIPHQKGMQAQTPIERYQYAKTHGWDGLRRLSESTIENRYICALKRFYHWAMEAEKYLGKLPNFRLVGQNNLPTLERDSFSDDELKRLFSLPKFTGHLALNSKKEGPFLVQDHIYWSYVILNLTGMRPGEIAQLEIEDVRTVEGVFYFDLRPFDPAKGRVARETIKSFKTGAASRLVPIHPTIIELGLIERAKKLAELGHTRLFPDCQPKVLKGGDRKWGDALARDWQRRKADVTTRANVSAYSGRHSMADLLRDLKISPHDCEKFLGHSHAGINGRYGRKGLMPDTVVSAFLNTDAPIVRWLRDHLVAARDRIEEEGKLLEPWLVKPVPGKL